MSTLVGQVLRRSLAVWGAALVAVGVGTAALLHGMQVRAVDQALLAAAMRPGEADDEDEDAGEWELEHARSPVRVGWADPAQIPAEWLERVDRSERPLWVTDGDRRLLLILVEREDDDDDHERVVVASAPRPTLARTVGPFLLAYGAAAALVAGGAALVQRRWLLAAVRPLSEAVRTIEQAPGSAVGTRVTPAGPDEVRALLAAVDALLSRRDDAFRAQSRFSAAAAHELRTPVAAMLGELDVALRRVRTVEEYRAALGAAREEVRRLADLVEGLLLLARVDAGQAEQNRVREHAGALADEAARRERGAIEARGGTLRVELGADPEVEVHQALVVAALANLLRNAAVHAPGSAVALRTEAGEGTLRFVVEDDGPGFPARPRTSGGLGLGLKLATEIARRHGGDCRVSPRERGAAVELWLPLPA